MSTTQPDFNGIRAVIFDMDGTLIQHTWQMSDICQALYDRFADDLAPVSLGEFFDCYWTKSHDMWHMMVDQILAGEVAAKYAYVNTLRALGHDPELGEAMLNHWTDLVLEEAIPFDDTYTVLEAVRKKYKTGILTNGYIRLQRKKIARYNLDEYVDFTLVSEEAGYHKPDTRAFTAAIELAGEMTASNVIYVGDNLEADIKGGLAAGVTPVLIDTKYKLSAPNGVTKINKLSELLDLLNL